MPSSTPAPSTPAALIDEARVRIGLSRPQMERLVAQYGYSDPDSPPAIRDLERFLAKLVREHDRFMRNTISRAHELASANGGYLLTAEVSEVTGMGEFQVANLRRRKKITSKVPAGQRYPHYALDDVLAFVHAKPKYREHHSPLSWAFLRVLAERMPPPEPTGASPRVETAERELAATPA